MLLRAPLAVAALLLTAPDAPANDDPFAPLPFIGGVAAGFVLHESGHVALDLAFGAHPGLRKVDFNGIPFFAVTHDRVTPRQEFLISWAGFGTQHAASEWILTRQPDLKETGSPFTRGVLAFHVLCSAVYGVGAFGGTGPSERDTLGMAVSVDVDERAIGVLVVVPAALDTYRYFHPRARWAAWTSRVLKIGLLALVVR